ncbi:MAG: hypothetical protein ABSH11_12775 [Verrucomicrobiota bacterium]|jgi:hypothetical protein
MKKYNLIAIAGAAVLLCSCIPSINPFYTVKDVVFDARLLGEWQEKDKSDNPDVWKFEGTTNKMYKLTITEKGDKQGRFNAHLFQLKQEYFLDLIPDDCNYATNQADLVTASMFPGHLLVRVPQLEPELKLAFFDFDWLQKHLEKNPKALAHHIEDKRIVLTAETRDLQKFVLKHLDELFEKPDEMIRRTNSVPAVTPPGSQ